MAFTSFPGPDFAFASLSPDDGALTDQLIAWHRRADAAGRVACVYLRANWCGANVKLERSLVDPQMQQALRGVDAAVLDVDVWVDALADAGLSPRVVPIFYPIGADGRPTGPSITGGAWKDDIPENMAPPLAAFFERARADRPAPPAPVASTSPPFAAYSPPLPPARVPSRVGAIFMLIGALLLIAFAAWLKVRQDDDQRREQQSERIQKDVSESIQRSLREQKK